MFISIRLLNGKTINYVSLSAAEADSQNMPRTNTNDYVTNTRILHESLTHSKNPAVVDMILTFSSFLKSGSPTMIPPMYSNRIRTFRFLHYVHYTMTGDEFFDHKIENDVPALQFLARMSFRNIMEAVLHMESNIWRYYNELEKSGATNKNGGGDMLVSVTHSTSESPSPSPSTSSSSSIEERKKIIKYIKEKADTSFPKKLKSSFTTMNDKIWSSTTSKGGATTATDTTEAATSYSKEDNLKRVSSKASLTLSIWIASYLLPLTDHNIVQVCHQFNNDQKQIVSFLDQMPSLPKGESYDTVELDGLMKMEKFKQIRFRSKANVAPPTQPKAVEVEAKKTPVLHLRVAPPPQQASKKKSKSYVTKEPNQEILKALLEEVEEETLLTSQQESCKTKKRKKKAISKNKKKDSLGDNPQPFTEACVSIHTLIEQMKSVPGVISRSPEELLAAQKWMHRRFEEAAGSTNVVVWSELMSERR